MNPKVFVLLMQGKMNMQITPCKFVISQTNNKIPSGKLYMTSRISIIN